MCNLLCDANVIKMNVLSVVICIIRIKDTNIDAARADFHTLLALAIVADNTNDAKWQQR